MNILQRISRRIIKASFDISVSTIGNFSNLDKYYGKVDELRQLENGTLGKEVANCLDNHKLTLVPKYESHDLKHVLLGYKMTAEDEIRMQAFMIGNGNYSLPTFTIFFFGAILLPELWWTFYSDFKKGRQIAPISQWTIEDFRNRKITELRAELTQLTTHKRKLINMKILTQFAAMAAGLTGIFGMLVCLPFCIHQIWLTW